MLLKRISVWLAMAAAFSNANLISQSTHGAWWRGDVRFLTEQVRVKVCPAFLDIEEEIVMAPTVSSWGTPQDSGRLTLELTGGFFLPQGSVIVGALLWNGSEILKARLKPKDMARNAYDSIVDRQTAIPPAPRDPMIIEQTGANNYNLSIYPVAWGATRKIRIRYLLPNSVSSSGIRTVLPLFGAQFGMAQSNLPTQIPLNLTGAAGITAIKFEQSGSIFNKVLPATVYCNYNDAFFIRNADVTSPMMAGTQFTTGDWAGDYILYTSDVPESLLVNAGLRMEVVFLWKWIEFGSFVAWSTGSKTLSQYGDIALHQAASIRYAAEDIVQGPAKVGMILDKGDSNYTIFPLGAKGTKNFQDMQDYLSQFNSSYLLNTIIGDEFSTPGNFNSAKFREKYAHEFSVSMQKAYSLYSPSQKVIKHLILVTVGPKLTTETPQSIFSYYTEPAYFQGITVTGYSTYPRYIDYGGYGYWSYAAESAYWPGVPVFRFTADHALQSQGYNTQGYTIPMFQSANFSVTVKSPLKNYNYDMVTSKTSDGRPVLPSFSFSGHCIGNWDSTVYWSAVDPYGNQIASYSQKPAVLRSPLDSCLVKLWAGSPNAVSEVYTQGGLGAVYGIVTQEYSLLALESDSIGAAATADLAHAGVPLLADSEIFVYSQMPAVEHRVRKIAILGLDNQPNPFNPTTWIVFQLTRKSNVRITVFDIQGRRIALLADGLYEAGAHRVLFQGKTLPSGLYVCRMEAEGKVLTRNMMLMK